MPFEVLRRHQKWLLAVLGILAMISFVVSDSVPKLLSPSYGGRDPEIATLYQQKIHRSNLRQMQDERNLANLVAYDVNMFLGPHWFGETKDRDMIDALILQHEADRLGLPVTTEQGREFLEAISNRRMNGDRFENLLAKLNARVHGDQVLLAIANQLRIKSVRFLNGKPLITPYDVFRIYREQTERVGAKVVAIPVESFLGKVPDPTEEEIQDMYEKYKDVLPDPESDTPGFKVPRQIQVEILSVDSNALAKGMRDKLTETELRTAYENHKTEYPMRSELPADLFAGHPELTPPILRPFDEVRSVLAVRVAEEKAQADITKRFGDIKDDVMIPFANDYSTAVDELAEAKKQNPNATAVLPISPDVKAVAERQGMSYELTRLLSREDAESFGPISSALVGTHRMSDGRKFADEMFDPKKGLYEPEEFTDVIGIRFLARKMKDVPPHVPELISVHFDVSLACKMAKARALAEKSAQDLAAELKKKGAALKDSTYQGYRVLTIPPTARRQFSYRASDPDRPIPEESPIADVPHVGDAFRNAYFGLERGAVGVAPDQPRKVFYVMTFESREPATFAALYADNGDELRYKRSAIELSTQQLEDAWMAYLRAEAGLQPDWAPPVPDEGKKESSEDDS